MDLSFWLPLLLLSPFLISHLCLLLHSINFLKSLPRSLHGQVEGQLEEELEGRLRVVEELRRSLGRRVRQFGEPEGGEQGEEEQDGHSWTEYTWNLFCDLFFEAFPLTGKPNPPERRRRRITSGKGELFKQGVQT